MAGEYPARGFATEVTLAEVRDRLPEDLSLDGGLKVALLNPPGDPLDHVTVDNMIPAVETGLAKQAKLEEVRALVAAVATEATQEAMLAVVNTLAKDASVDNVEEKLTTLLAKDFSTAAHQTSMEAILTQIAANTNTAAVEIADLELTADQVNLNTDALETILTSLNGKDFATAAKQTGQQAALDAINTKLGGTLTADITDRAARLLGHVTIDNASLAVTGPLTDAQLRAAAVPVSDATLAALISGGRLAVASDTELPTAAALTDADGNPTVPGVGAYGMLWNPNTPGWTRTRSYGASYDISGTALGGIAGAGLIAWDDAGSTARWVRLAAADSVLGNRLLGAGLYAINSIGNMDRLRGLDAIPTNGYQNSGSGILATAALLWDNNNKWWRPLGAVADGLNPWQVPAAGLMGYNGSTEDRVRTGDPGDGVGSLGRFHVGQMVYNGTAADRFRNNFGIGVGIGAAARTATVTSVDNTNWNHRSAQFILDVTAAVAGTGGLTLRVEGKDVQSGKYYTIFQDAAAITAVGTYVFEIGAGLDAAAAGIRGKGGRILPRTFRVIVTHGDATSYTYSVGVNFQV